jgi:hypothetical protein
MFCLMIWIKCEDFMKINGKIRKPLEEIVVYK